jgi:hypothetical protein
VGFLWLEAVGAAGPCAVSQDRWRRLSWVVACGVWWAVGLVVVSLPLGCGLGWPLLLWVEPRQVTRCVWGGWGRWAMCCVLGQVVVAVMDVWWVVGLVVVPLVCGLGWPSLSWAGDL